MNIQKETDKTLVMLTLAGDQDAYEKLVLRYQRAVTASAITITRSQYMAEDAAQDAFVTAWMKLNTLQDGSKFSAWVCQIAKNCAKNMMRRYRSFLPLEAVENLEYDDDVDVNPAELTMQNENKSEISQAIGRLPRRVGEIIRLHYFEELSITEIADRLSISEGTVKWQLHDGRKRIRKELCAMDEKYYDTLVERVMKKVAELKLWQYKNSKSGFEVVYKDVLREVEELPESQDRAHALADVLMRGWWWLPGSKNDALYERIVQAATDGMNEDVMSFIVSREDSKRWGSDKRKFIKDKQIPRLEKAGFVKTLAREWFWYGYYCFRDGESDEGKAAYQKVKELLCEGESYRDRLPYALNMEEVLEKYEGSVKKNDYEIKTVIDELRFDGKKPRFWNNDSFDEGYMASYDSKMSKIIRNACLCDGWFTADMAVGESIVGSDGTRLTYASEGEYVDTPIGSFEGCKLFVTEHFTSYGGNNVYKTYYKDGVGIVKQLHTANGCSDVRTLSGYRIAGGSGLLPIAKGNRWEYAASYSPDCIESELTIDVTYTDDEKAMLATWSSVRRKKYDENSWIEMVQQIAGDYFDSGECMVHDVSHAIERAEALAATPYERAYTKAAASVARRIMETDPEFNPDYKATGHWNFFQRGTVYKVGDAVKLTEYDGRWDFELKSINCNAAYQVIVNDIYYMLLDATGSLWSDEWQIGATPLVEYNRYDRTITTKISCEDGGRVTTKAGVFENCMKLVLDIKGMTDGWDYRGGKKVYYFAKGVGIVRVENELFEGSMTVVYELTAYEGVGEGYFPIAVGMTRRYEGIDFTDGFIGSADYCYVDDGNGNIVIITDRCGIRKKLEKITTYDNIYGELVEEELWERGKYIESRTACAVNYVNILLHLLGRNQRSWALPERGVAWSNYKIKLLDTLRVDGELPRAWLGMYAEAYFGLAVRLFGCDRKEEGYKALNYALCDLYTKWVAIPKGELLELGDKEIFYGVKYIKGHEMLELPDQKRSAISEKYLLDPYIPHLYYGMTAPQGWEWFNSVREEDRFKKYIEIAKELADKCEQ